MVPLLQADIALCRNKQYLLTHNISELRDAQSVTQKEWTLLDRHDQARFVTKCLNEARKQGVLSIQNLTTVHSRRCPLVHFALTLPVSKRAQFSRIFHSFSVENHQHRGHLSEQRARHCKYTMAERSMHATACCCRFDNSTSRVGAF